MYSCTTRTHSDGRNAGTTEHWFAIFNNVFRVLVFIPAKCDGVNLKLNVKDRFYFTTCESVRLPRSPVWVVGLAIRKHRVNFVRIKQFVLLGGHPIIIIVGTYMSYARATLVCLSSIFN